MPVELILEHQTLVFGELVPDLRDSLQIASRLHQLLHVGPRIDERRCVRSVELGGVSERRLDRTAAAKGATPIVDARQQFLLERTSNVAAALERARPRPLRTHQQLLRGLAVTVFEVGTHQAMAVDREQQLATRGDHVRDRIGEIDRTDPSGASRPARQDRSLRALTSGRHESMSRQVALTPPSKLAGAALRAIDRYQRRSPRLGFAVATVKRFQDDEASHMGALIAYYGFFSLFPLLLVFVTVLGFVLQGNPSVRASVLHSTLSQFPIIGTQLQSNVHSLKGDVLALAVGLVGALFAGLGITGATRNAFDRVWRIPKRRRLGFLAWRLRGIGLLALLGTLSIVSTVVAGYVTSETAGVIAVVAGVVIALLVNLALFATVFRMLTSEEIETRLLLPGVIFAAIMWLALQHVGGLYVEHVVRHAKDTSGLFAFVLGLLSWLYLGGQMILLAAEANVVRARGLWPRSLLDDSSAEGSQEAS
jgi:membrane protein